MLSLQWQLLLLFRTPLCKCKIPITLSNRLHNVGIEGYDHASWVPAEIPRFNEASAPHLPLPARDEQGLRDERVEDARASGMLDKSQHRIFCHRLPVLSFKCNLHVFLIHGTILLYQISHKVAASLLAIDRRKRHILADGLRSVARAALRLGN